MIPARPNRELISTLDSALRVYMQHERLTDFGLNPIRQNPEIASARFSTDTCESCREMDRSQKGEEARLQRP